jgi:hypothetical protein
MRHFILRAGRIKIFGLNRSRRCFALVYEQQKELVGTD